MDRKPGNRPAPIAWGRFDLRETFAVRGWHDGRRLGLAAAALAMVGLIDFWTGLDIRVDLFYALIVIVVAWYEGPRWAIATGILACLLHLLDFSEHLRTGRVVAVVWNASLDLSFYLLSTLLIQNIIRLSLQLADRYEEVKRESALREDLMYVVSHDLKTPLASVILNAEMVDRVAGEPTHSFVSGIRKSCRRMNLMINDLLDYARIQEGRLIMNLGDWDVADIVSETVEQRLELARSKGVELASAIPECLPKVHVDRERLIQVLGNLVDNAIKFAPAATTVTISAQVRHGDLCISVADRGPGIRAENLPLLFERFWQAPRDRKAADTGSGFGLAIAKSLIDAHHGHIWATSTPGLGTTVHATVPLAPAMTVPLAQRAG